MGRLNTESCIFVILGATGDLMHRKLMPALYHLRNDDLLPARCHILGVGRDEKLTDDRFRTQPQAALAKAGLPARQKIRRWCDACLHRQGVGAGGAANCARLAARMGELECGRAMRGNRVLYLALRPAAFPGTIDALRRTWLNPCRGWGPAW